MLNVPEKYLIEREWQEDPDMERKARYEDPSWNTAPLSEAEAYDLLQEELCGITAEDLEPEPTAEERELDRWLNADPESFYGYLPRSAK